MKTTRRVNNWEFKWNEDCNCYEARGEVMYDDEHDEIPEPSLWDAAKKLANELKSEGVNAQPTWSEKGWVEVEVLVTAKS
tara:strand:+ start:87 stop:326 length:240 start_codon:yes stop_codon:yes gene_type:complete